MILKTILTISLFCISLNVATGQNVAEILKLSQKNCMKADHGYYEMAMSSKFLTEKDTISDKIRCWFKREPNDEIYGSLFHYYLKRNNKNLKDILYSGNELVENFPPDSTALIISVKQYRKYLLSTRHNQLFSLYKPFADSICFPFLNNNGEIKKEFNCRILQDKTSLETSNYCIEVAQASGSFKQLYMRQIKQEYLCWINKKTLLPNRIVDISRWIMNNDTLDQYLSQVLIKTDFNDESVDKKLTLKSIPPFLKIKTYEPTPQIPLLKNGITAPNWKLVSLTKDSVSLSDFKGRVVLIDFFYSSCYPCRLAIPELEALYKKFKDDGFVVVGIDPVDKKIPELEKFVSKTGISYPVLLSGKEIPKMWNVSSYPTIYILDTSGKIIYSIVGYGEGIKDEIERIITKLL